MKKRLLILMVLCCQVMGGRAQTATPGASLKGSSQIKLGYGPLSYSGMVLNFVRNRLDYNDVSQIEVQGPVHLRYTYRFGERWSLGASLNYARYSAVFKDVQISPSNQEVEVDINLSMTSYSALARIQFFPIVQEKIEVYLGASLGLRIPSYSVGANVPWASVSTPGFIPIGAEAVLGICYMPAEKFGLYTEIGAAKSPFQLGLVYRILGS